MSMEMSALPQYLSRSGIKWLAKKAILVAGFLLVTAAIQLKALKPDSLFVKQEIHYLSGSAEEVFLVWGVNNWSPVDSHYFPEGSFKKDGLVYSPMKKQDEF